MSLEAQLESAKQREDDNLLQLALVDAEGFVARLRQQKIRIPIGDTVDVDTRKLGSFLAKNNVLGRFLREVELFAAASENDLDPLRYS